MTDVISTTGDSSLADTLSIASNDRAETTQNVVAAPLAVEAVAEAPNGFLTLGLAPELIQAVKDLGFTQPTTVQLKTIPLAMQGAAGAEGAARFIDLMVSSQAKPVAARPRLFCCRCCTPC